MASEAWAGGEARMVEVVRKGEADDWERVPDRDLKLMSTDSEVEDFLQRPLAEIIDEVKRLRAENTSLAVANSTQARVFGLYTSQLVETKSLLRAVRYGLQLPLLPPEILLAIFRFTQPPGPPYRHEPSTFRGPRNPWLESLKTKKALILVCKAWSAPATELLYSDVVLRRMGQISALANTFRSDRKHNLANLVRAIRLDTCVVLTHCGHAVREDFEYILRRCRMLSSFVYIPPPHPQFPFLVHENFASGATPPAPTAYNPTWILDIRHGRAGGLLAKSLNSRLLTLHLGLTTYDGSFHSLAHILSSAPHLTSLKLANMSPWPDNPPIDASSPLPDLSFPALETLSIHCDSAPFIHYVTTQWTMPRLTTLTCTDADEIPTHLLVAHGEQLTYLHFRYTYIRYDLEANTDLLPHLHELCPRILHLAVLIVPEERTALNIHSATLRYLDICGSPSVEAYRAIALAPTARAPRLRKVRMIVDSYDFVPRYFHPAHMPGSDRALEDLSSIPGAQESDSGRANWLMYTSGGITADLPVELRQHSWAVAADALWFGFPPPEGVEDPRVPNEDETDSEGEYEYESPPSSPGPSGAGTRANDIEGGDDGCETGDGHTHEDDEDDSDSDMERGWYKVEDHPVSVPIAFVDDLLDSRRRQYDRETILERFSQSQLGDFLLE